MYSNYEINELILKDDDMDFSMNEIDYNGIDITASQFFHYPCNMSIRKYQLDIVKKALHKNILLCLPTGLGKTFIAAVIMMNYYRWYPKGKVIFLAPTKPLVHQQQDACVSIVGIPQHDCTWITGTIAPDKRKSLYTDFRILFMTAQVLQNDILLGLCDTKSIICVVLDEAHKATGNHAYCQVIKLILDAATNVRILGLTASPGQDSKAIQSLVDNLVINEIVHYNEEDAEIKPYVHSRRISEKILNFEGELEIIVKEFSDIIENKLQKLSEKKGLSNPNISSWPSFRIIKQIEIMSNKKAIFSIENYRRIMSELISLRFYVSALERLISYGVVPFYRYVIAHSTNEFKTHVEFYEKIYHMQNNFESSIKNKILPAFPFHPKITAVLQILDRHFDDPESKNSKVIIFTQYRDSVDEIIFSLSFAKANVKPIPFVGQSSSKHSKGLLQKDQIEALSNFKDGLYNVLVSTCVGEEGLDICEVNLIIFFDVTSSPLRLIQRSGRTGRKGTGEIILLLMEGNEEKNYIRAKYKTKSMNNALKNINKIYFSESKPCMPMSNNIHCVFTLISTTPSFNLSNIKVKKSKNFKGVPALNSVNIDLNFIKPSFISSTFHILNDSLHIFHSLKSHAKHKILISMPQFYANNFQTQICSILDTDFRLPDACSLRNLHSEIFPNQEKNESLSPPNFQQDVKAQAEEVFLSPPIFNKDSSDEVVILASDSPIKLKAKKRKIPDSSNDTFDSLADKSIKAMKSENKFAVPIKRTLARDMLLTQAGVIEDCSDDSDLVDEEYALDSFINDESLNGSRLSSTHIYKHGVISPHKTDSRWAQLIKGIEDKLIKNKNESFITIDEEQNSDGVQVIGSQSSSYLVDNCDSFESPKRLIDINMLKLPSVIPTMICNDETHYSGITEPYILVNSKSFLNSQIPNILRNKHQLKIINFTSMPFDYILSRHIAVDILKLDDLSKSSYIYEIFNKYESLKAVYNTLVIIIQKHERNSLEFVPSMIGHLYTILSSLKLNSFKLFFSYSQNKTAHIIYQLFQCVEEEFLFMLPDIRPNILNNLIKCASILSNINIIFPTTAIDLLISATSFKKLITNSSPPQLQMWSNFITKSESERLFEIFCQLISLK